MLGLLGLFVGNSLAPMADDPPELIPSVGIVELLVQAAFLVAIAYIAVGLPYWRDLRAATERLGIVAPDLRTIGIAIAATFACFVVAAIAGLVSQQFDPGLSESLDEVVDQITAGAEPDRRRRAGSQRRDWRGSHLSRPCNPATASSSPRSCS